MEIRIRLNPSEYKRIEDNSNRTIGKRIGLKADGIFPLSLKNLARINIKQSLCDYSVKNVAKLENLPEALKDFVLFREENERLLKSVSN